MAPASDQYTVLIIEDDPNTTALVALYLKREGFRVLTAGDGKTGLALARQHRPDMVILDLMLPKMDGWEICRRLRRFSDVPVIMLTARGEEVDRIAGLTLGADDYVVKPYSLIELMARVRGQLRRTRPAATGALLEFGDIVLDSDTHRARRGDTELKLGPTEFRLLEFLMQSPGRVFTREQLLDSVWGHDVYVDERTVDVHIGRLRRSINRGRLKDPIRTVRGAGYAFDEQFARAD